MYHRKETAKQFRAVFCHLLGKHNETRYAVRMQLDHVQSELTVRAVKRLATFTMSDTQSGTTLNELLSFFLKVNSGWHSFVVDRGFYWPGNALPAAFKRKPARECFQNAGELALRFPDSLTYVEGLAHRMIPVPHAWCVTAEGQVVDPTWDNPEEAAYFGIPIRYDYLKNHVLNEKVWGLFGEMISPTLIDTPVDTMVHPDWLPLLNSPATRP